MLSWVVRLFGRRQVGWKEDAKGLSVCWVCGISMPDDWTRFIDRKHGSYCMRHEDLVKGMKQRGVL